MRDKPSGDLILMNLRWPSLFLLRRWRSQWHCRHLHVKQYHYQSAPLRSFAQGPQFTFPISFFIFDVNKTRIPADTRSPAAIAPCISDPIHTPAAACSSRTLVLVSQQTS
jgi:hypothetical protein